MNSIALFNPACTRLHDNDALAGAIAHAQRGGRVTLAYIHSPSEEPELENTGGCPLLYLAKTLEALDGLIARRFQTRLRCIRASDESSLVGEIAQLVVATGATAIFAPKRYDHGPAPTVEALRKHGCKAALTLCTGYLLYEPAAVAKHRNAPKTGGRFSHFATLTDFTRMCGPVALRPKVTSTAPPPRGSSKFSQPPAGVAATVDVLQLYNPAPQWPPPVDGAGPVDWGPAVMPHWEFGEEAGLRALGAFLSDGRFARYEKDRSRADGQSTNSMLSPFLRFGALSVRLMHGRMLDSGGYGVSKTSTRRLIWRDLAYFQLYVFPDLATEPIRPAHRLQWWQDVTDGHEGAARFRRWKSGRTGFPLVDAGMRELWATGWMQQNVRMVCAQFLTDVLRISWVEGAKWFAETLVDADPAINGMMWQNAGRSGIDQWNFFMNPVTNPKSSDPNCAYVKKWLPELAGLPTKDCLAPWKLPAAPPGYCKPMVEPTEVVRIANAVITQEMIRCKQDGGPALSDSSGYDVITLPACIGGGKTKIFTRERFRSIYKAKTGVWEQPDFSWKQSRKQAGGPGHGRARPQTGQRLAATPGPGSNVSGSSGMGAAAGSKARRKNHGAGRPSKRPSVLMQVRAHARSKGSVMSTAMQESARNVF